MGLLDVVFIIVIIIVLFYTLYNNRKTKNETKPLPIYSYSKSFFKSNVEEYMSRIDDVVTSLDFSKGNLNNIFATNSIGICIRGLCTMYDVIYHTKLLSSAVRDEYLEQLYYYICDISTKILSFQNTTVEMWTGTIEPVWPNTEDAASAVSVSEQALIAGHLAFSSYCIQLHKGDEELIKKLNTSVMKVHEYLETYVVLMQNGLLFYRSTIPSTNTNRNKYCPWNQLFMFTYMYTHMLTAIDDINKTFFIDRLQVLYDSVKSYLIEAENKTLWYYELARHLDTSRVYTYEDMGHANLDYHGFFNGYINGYLDEETMRKITNTIFSNRIYDCTFAKYINGSSGIDQPYLRENFYYGFRFVDYMNEIFVSTCRFPNIIVYAILAFVSSNKLTQV